MRYILYLLFIGINLNGQGIINLSVPDTVTRTGTGIIDLSKYYTTGIDYTLLVSYDATMVSLDSLTFNSTGDTITFVSNDTVVLDTNNNVFIGNSIRFTSPTGTTIYTILDTLGNSDSLILDQSCTANIGDELYPGCVGIIYDASVYGSNATQTVGIEQPKGIWIGTDTASFYCDGSNINLIIVEDDLLDPDANHSWCFKIKFDIFTTASKRVFSNNIAANGYEIYNKNDDIEFRVYTAASNEQKILYENLIEDTYYHICIIKSNKTYTTYVDGVKNSEVTYTNDILPASGAFKQSTIGLSSIGTNGITGYIGEFKMYSRELTEDEAENYK